MADPATCPRGHRFEPVEGPASICPECAAESVPPSQEWDPYKTSDELPPPPIPLPTGWHSTEEEKKSQHAAELERESFLSRGYEILNELGRGGMGVVYKARQVSLDRPVALKMILGGGPVFSEELARFRMEADAFAQLRHPNIVQIYEIGELDGRPFLALEFVEGGTLSGRLAGAPIDPRLSAHIVETLAHAMHFAHARNIIHRDLKPANILLALVPGDSAAVALTIDAWQRTTIPKVTDFGLAKRLDRDTGQTRTGSIMGTPSYMAPEQAAGAGPSGAEDSIGPATDTYALGAILYEMLTGRPPFRGVTAIQTVQQVLHDEPIPPRRLQPGVPFDLETICLKCLAKEPGRRYASAEELAKDLARFLAGQPILARPTSWHERTAKWIRRNRTLTGLLGISAVALLLLVGLGVGAYYNSLLKESRALTQRYHYSAEMNRAQNFWRENQTPRLLTLLKTFDYVEPGQRDLRSFEWRYLAGLCHNDLLTFAEHAHPVTCVAYSPTENLIASGSGKTTLTNTGIEGFGEVRLWNPDTGQRRSLLKGHTREVNGVAFSPDGKQLATASSDKSVRVWDVAKRSSLLELKGHSADVTSVAFHPRGDLLASGSWDSTIILWDTKTGQRVRTFQRERGEPILSLAFSPDGARLLSGGGDLRKPGAGEFALWDIADARLIEGSKKKHGNAVTCVAFHPDGGTYATAGEDKSIRIWDAANEKETCLLRSHTDSVMSLAFDKTGTRLASASLDLTAIVWNPTSGEKICSRKGHLDGLRGVAFSTDGTRIISAANDNTVKIWSTAGDQEFTRLGGQSETDVAFSPNGRLLASASLDGNVNIWDVDQRKPRATLIGDASPLSCIAFPFDTDNAGQPWHVVTGGADGTISFWNVVTEKLIDRLNSPRTQTNALAISHDGALLASSGIQDDDESKPAAITLWDTRTKKPVATLSGHSGHVTFLAFSPDGKRLASCGAGEKGGVKIWEVASHKEIASIVVEHPTAPRAVFSPDGRRLAIANGDVDRGNIRIHNAATGKEELRLTNHAGMASTHAFSPDGERLVTTDGKFGAPSRIKLWDAQTGQEVLTLPGPTGLVSALVFSADGRRLASLSSPLQQRPGEIILWDAPPR